ncbi:MAG: ribosome maturation factor RimM [Herbaspirillum sp.]
MRSGAAVPADLVTIAYVSGAYGVQGWVRVRPYSADADALLSAKTWWLDKPELRDIGIVQARRHSADVVAQLMGVADRDAAQALKGAVVRIARSHFPALPDGEFYWVDLIGLAVENLRGESLGVVSDLMDNGAHPILRIAVPADAASSKAVAEILLPYVGQFVKSVILAQKKMIVDWERDD